MVIRYTPDEWAKLTLLQQERLLDLAPEGVAEQWATQRQQFIHKQRDGLLELVGAAGVRLAAIKKAQSAIEYYRTAGDEVSKADFVAFIEQLNFSALDIAELVSQGYIKQQEISEHFTEQRRKGGRAKYTGWEEALLELYCQNSNRYKNKEDFFAQIAGVPINVAGGKVVNAPEVETIRKKLTGRRIATYLHERDVQRRRDGTN